MKNNLVYFYDKTRHLKLLKIKGLSGQEFSKFIAENPYQLESYTVMLMSHLHWQNRGQYIELIEKLLNGPIDFDNFEPLREKFKAINDAVTILESQLILFEPNTSSEEFGYLIQELVLLFDRFCPDSTTRESHELSEDELKEFIQQALEEMKDDYP